MKLYFAAAFLAWIPAPAMAQSHDHNHDHQRQHAAGQMHETAGAMGLPQQPGQGAFGAIAEIVSMLRADPATDWSLVDIGALRQHLIDMDRLIFETTVIQADIPNGIEMTIIANQSTRAMVPAHAAVLPAETGWASEVRTTDDQIIWRVTSPTDPAMIRGLGFFGLMATGNHHPVHHLALATGRPMH